MGKKRSRNWPEAPEPLAAPITDNHTHLPLRSSEIPKTEGPSLSLEQQLQRATEVGVTQVITSACEVMDLAPALALAEQYPQVRVAVAIHPNEAALHAGFNEPSPDGLEPEFSAHHSMSLESAIAAVCDAAAHPAVAAIGETGLDYFRTAGPGREAQKVSFRAHIELAKALNLPMQIHDRDAHEDTIAILRECGAPEKTIFHCYSGDEQMARVLAEEGWYASFAGPVTYPANHDLRAALAVLPKELILVETDAPYLSPKAHRGQPNASYLMADTVRFMAQFLGLTELDFIQQIQRNTEEVYGQW
ncbi:deoxyribonuclease [Boudabousia liubingyangii]|uniref:Deoxyribonuclease n=1 Tax=Boudabousia liubingyangii TaxID=1921764 RepID=A0A1Q5PJU5_9ACTO|nr:TatD family hydrolase [Boudabousia liubingyangii]OKL46179.1 deoxyribonuclease [Boudabousia liubingyangii]